MRSHLATVVLIVGALASGGGIYAITSGSLEGLIGPRGPEEVLAQVAQDQPTSLIHPVFEQISPSQTESRPSVRDAVATMRIEHVVPCDLNGDGLEDRLGIYSVQDEQSRDFFTAAAIAADGDDARLVQSTFIGTDLQLDPPGILEDGNVYLTGGVPAAASAVAPGSAEPGNATPFSEVISLDNQGKLHIELGSIGDIAGDRPAPQVQQIGEVVMQGGADEPEFTVSGTMRLGKPADIHVHVPDTHTLTVTHKSGEPVTDLAIAVIDENGQLHRLNPEGVVEVTGDATVRLASDNALLTAVDVKVAVIPKSQP